FVPVQYGLYSSFMGCFVYCFLGTAKDVTLGPTAIMSLLVSSYAFHEPVYAILLAFLSGCIQLAMGLLHLGFLLDFISCPVIKGFAAAASITISFNQVKNILGLRGIPRQFFLQVYETLRRIGETRSAPSLHPRCSIPLRLRGLGLRGCFAPRLFGHTLDPFSSRLPRAARAKPLVARVSYLIVWTSATVFMVALSTAARNALVVLFAGLVAYSFQVMGSHSMAAPNGTVPFSSMVEDMGVGLAVVPLMGLLETVAIAKAFASQNDYRIDTNQELLAMGFANILGSFVSSYPITGSFGSLTGSRSVRKGVSQELRAGEGASLSLLPLVSAVSEGSMLLVQPGSSLHFPAIECLRDAVCSRTLAASPPRSIILDCCHISSIDYTVVVGLAELLQELRKHGLSLAFCSLQDPVLQVLLSADLEGFQHFPSREEA
ncbi:PREDICTED: sodium-independent sulfate anion transporter, partial [Tauraco erythrolophus]|uniref:sodium-independent sulfate anion transporter n=1 Tax=Tauraco erythrolophus TaxID=121530 RepID=UPI00052373DE